MKRLPAILIMLLVIGYIVYSFIHETPKNTEKTMRMNRRQVQGKWRILNYTKNDHYENSDHHEVVYGKSRDYMYFRTSGKVAYSLGADVSTSDYSLTTDSTIQYGQRTCLIQGINSNSLSLVYKSTPDANNRYQEISYSLMKR